jgi:ABC-type molybdate transport system substrate-binding protein
MRGWFSRSLIAALVEIAARFQARNPGVEVKATFGASGIFFAQIANGAPFDLFLSADAEFPARLVEQGLAARAALEKAGLQESLKGRIVMGQSVNHAAQFAWSGNAAGCIPAPVPDPGPAALRRRARLAGAIHRELAAFLLGDDGRRMLASFGYDLPGN